MSRKFNLKVQQGKLSFSSDTHKAMFNEFLKENEGKIVQVVKHVPIRSNTQNNFYWLYLSIIEAETGNNANDLHELFKRTLLTPKHITVLGKELKIPASTTELTKIEFGEYIDKICAATNVPIPDPVEAGYAAPWER